MGEDGFVKYRLAGREDVSSTCAIFTLRPVLGGKGLEVEKENGDGDVDGQDRQQRAIKKESTRHHDRLHLPSDMNEKHLGNERGPCRAGRGAAHRPGLS